MSKKNNIHPSILKIKKEIIDNRRYFHKYPELSFEEYNTSKTIEKKLLDMNIDVKSGIAKTGLIGSIKGKKKGNKR